MARLLRLQKEIPLDQLTVDEPLDRAGFEHLAWIDKNNVTHDIAYPLTPAVLKDLKSQMEKLAPLKVEEATDTAPAKSYFVVRKYRDTFLPSITLALALEYMHKKMSDAEIVLGRYIRIPSPKSTTWTPSGGSRTPLRSPPPSTTRTATSRNRENTGKSPRS